MSTPPFVPISGFPGYFVNQLGEVASTRRGSMRLLKGRPRQPARNGNLPYLSVALYITPGVAVAKMVHHLVLETFVGPRPDGMEARHLNSDCQDNRLENLAWGTKKENGADKIARRPNCSRCDRPLEGRNLMMKKNGKKRVRACRACHNERTLAAYHNRKEVAGR